MSRPITWLASYPKSGNTWFRAVAVAWTSKRPIDLDALRAPGIESIASSRARFERALGIPTSLLTADEIDLLRPRVDEVVIGRWAVATDPSTADDEADADHRADPSPTGAAVGTRLSKIHDALFVGPAGEPIVSVAATYGAVYIVRDPRDVAVSLAHHNGWTLERTVDAMADPEGAMSAATDRVPEQVRQRTGSWSDHVRSWLDQRHVPVHVVRYEDLHRDPVAAFTEALRFAGYPADPADVAVAVDAARFDRLAEQERATGFPERGVVADRFFRRGIVGAFRDELPADLAARIAADHAEVMDRLGYGERYDAGGAR